MAAGKSLYYVGVYPWQFSAEQQALLEKYQAKSVHLAQLVENKWLLPSTHTEPQARLVIDRQTKTIIVDGVAISLSERLFVSALLIAQTGSKPLTAYDYSQQYWPAIQNFNHAVSIGSFEVPNLSKVVSELNKALRTKPKEQTLGILSRQSLSQSLLSSYSKFLK
jgi:hypothetical protein